MSIYFCQVAIEPTVPQVFYLWPTAGGSKFGFDFRLRYQMESSSAPSALYDYYNPEAAATVMPVRFSVH